MTCRQQTQRPHILDPLPLPIAIVKAVDRRQQTDGVRCTTLLDVNGRVYGILVVEHALKVNTHTYKLTKDRAQPHIQTPNKTRTWQEIGKEEKANQLLEDNSDLGF